jgi:hypothetical protein|tara:strand:- start:44 stop:322 length:279 start_codon:yes stop_codon:yes gene_type:complete
MEEYIVKVTDEDGESLSLKNYGQTLNEVVDNIVCMNQIDSIQKITRVKDNIVLINKTNTISLQKLRMLRQKIKNEPELRSMLVNKEEVNSIQ